MTPTPESIRLVQILLLEALDLVASHLRRAGREGGLHHPASRFAVSSPGEAMTQGQRGSRLF